MTHRSPITLADSQVSAVRNRLPVCIACTEGDHEQALHSGERCACPCHGIVIPSQAVAA
jgi:hypothetical protein